MTAALRASVLVLVAFVVGASAAAAQSFQGGLRGAVRDTQGVIPGVSLSLTNEATNVSRDTTTEPDASSSEWDNV